VRAQTRLPDQRGVSEIVGEVLMIAIIAIAMSSIAYVVVSRAVTPERYTDLMVRLENASPLPTESITTKSIKVVLFHIGGDKLGIPQRADDEFRVVGSHIGENSWENIVAWDNWTFSDPANGFELGEIAVGILRHDDATIRIGDKVRISVHDLYSDKTIRDFTYTVENSALYS